ncbi:MAG: hypothetical protein ACK40G_05420 [Cytophagaceae bacterium]
MTSTAIQSAYSLDSFIQLLSEQLNFSGNKEKTLNLLKVYFKTVFGQVSNESGKGFFSMLPVYLKPVCIEAFDLPDRVSLSTQDFPGLFLRNYGRMAHYDFADEQLAQNAIKKIKESIEEQMDEQRIIRFRKFYPEFLKFL